MAPSGGRSSRTMMVMMMAMTPSLKASSLPFAHRCMLARQASFEALLHRRPLVGQDRVVHRVPHEAVRQADVPAQDPLPHAADALDRPL